MKGEEVTVGSTPFSQNEYIALKLRPHNESGECAALIFLR